MDNNDCQTIIPPPKSWLCSTSSCNFYSCVLRSRVALPYTSICTAPHLPDHVKVQCISIILLPWWQPSFSIVASECEQQQQYWWRGQQLFKQWWRQQFCWRKQKRRALPPAVRFETIEVGNNNKMEREVGGFPLPINDQNSNYTWTPINTGERLQVMTDFTLACQKACRKIWCTASTDNTDDSSKQEFHGICSYHAWNAWHRHNRNRFRR